MDDPVLIDVRSRPCTSAEIEHSLDQGPGVFVLRGAYTDEILLDAVEKCFFGLIDGASGQADHFAAGSNQRLWNSVGKLAAAEPALFVEYYGNPWLHLACEAWLGPLYQVTAQVNVVVPSGVGQTGHRDYHLGFFPEALVNAMPDAFHQLSQRLTLQGAIVHCDVPLQKGPTRFVLGSQQESDGYSTFRSPEQQRRFESEATAMALEKGDLVLFNPKIFHAAGSNQTDTPRLVNLLQVSSAMAKPMESLDFEAMVQAVYPSLLGKDVETVSRVSKVLTDAYPFPTNLDLDPPGGDWLGQLEANWLTQQVEKQIDPETAVSAYRAKRRQRNA